MKKANTLFSLGTIFFLTLTSSLAHSADIPLEVKQFVTQLEQRLDFSERIKESRRDVVFAVHNFSYSALSSEVSSQLTDEQIVDFAASWSDLAFICQAYFASTYIELENEQELEEFFDGSNLCLSNEAYKVFTIGFKNKSDVVEFLKNSKAHAASLSLVANNLVASEYWHTNDFYQEYMANANAIFAGPEGDTIIREESFDDYFDNTKVFSFIIGGLGGIVGLTEERVRLIMADINML